VTVLRHAFVSAVADGIDPTVARASDWNADHVLAPGAGQLLWNSGTAVAQSADLTWDDAAKALGVRGVPVLTVSAASYYTQVADGSGAAALYLGGTGDPSNTHQNTTHAFTNRGGSVVFARIAAAGLGVGVVPVAWPGSYAVQVGTLALQSDSSTANVSMNLYYSAAWKYLGNGFGTLLNFDSGGGWSIYAAPSNAGGAGAAAGITQVFYVSTAGAVTALGSVTIPVAATYKVAGISVVGSDGAGGYSRFYDVAGTPCISAQAAGVYYDNTAHHFRTGAFAAILDLTAARVDASVPVHFKAYTVAGLPAGSAGDTAYVSDALGALAYMGAITGGGAQKVRVFYNGTAWLYA
jgi:hypothetical protein